FSVTVDTGDTLAVVETEDSVADQTGDFVKPVIVCVDDDRNNLQALSRVLRARCTVLVAETGEEAMGLVQEHPDIACVLADLRMPGLAGAELLARVAQ